MLNAQEERKYPFTSIGNGEVCLMLHLSVCLFFPLSSTPTSHQAARTLLEMRDATCYNSSRYKYLKSLHAESEVRREVWSASGYRTLAVPCESLKEAPGPAMITRIVLPIDANISPGTRLALQAAGELVALSPADGRLFLLHVIPVPIVSSPGRGMYRLHPTSGQSTQAEEGLSQARKTLREQAVHLERIEVLLHHGIPE